MRDLDSQWMAYIDREVRATCADIGCDHQVRRKWSVREKPVSASPLEDYEWKLIPKVAIDGILQTPDDSDQGTYFVLSCDRSDRSFLFQHDTVHVGVWNLSWCHETFTKIRIGCGLEGNNLREMIEHMDRGYESDPPPKDGWLHEHLMDLTSRFQPNHFSAT